MIKIDLITGFLGSGKTTFLKQYAAWLLGKGQRIGILEHDFGAVNVDMMILRDLEGENCELEMVSGGCDSDTHRRRFRTKLIAMGMSGYDRVLVEPSGIYDVDEFFDVLREEPLDRWYEIGSVIAVVDACPDLELSPEAEALLASEAACAGRILLSRTRQAGEEAPAKAEAFLNQALEKVRCSRRLQIGREILCKPWEEFTEEEFQELADCGFVPASYEKKNFREARAFESLFFMHVRLDREELCSAAAEILKDPDCGSVLRLKGFVRDGEQGWLELNAAKREQTVRPLPEGQEILIAIGENLNREKIEAYLEGGRKK